MGLSAGTQNGLPPSRSPPPSRRQQRRAGRNHLHPGCTYLHDADLCDARKRPNGRVLQGREAPRAASRAHLAQRQAAFVMLSASRLGARRDLVCVWGGGAAQNGPQEGSPSCLKRLRTMTGKGLIRRTDWNEWPHCSASAPGLEPGRRPVTGGEGPYPTPPTVELMLPPPPVGGVSP